MRWPLADLLADPDLHASGLEVAVHGHAAVVVQDPDIVGAAVVALAIRAGADEIRGRLHDQAVARGQDRRALGQGEIDGVQVLGVVVAEAAAEALFDADAVVVERQPVREIGRACVRIAGQLQQGGLEAGRQAWIERIQACQHARLQRRDDGAGRQRRHRPHVVGARQRKLDLHRPGGVVLGEEFVVAAPVLHPQADRIAGVARPRIIDRCGCRRRGLRRLARPEARVRRRRDGQRGDRQPAQPAEALVLHRTQDGASCRRRATSRRSKADTAWSRSSAYSAPLGKRAVTYGRAGLPRRSTLSVRR